METKTDSLTPSEDRPLLRGLGRWSFLIVLAVVMVVSFVSRFVRLPTSASGNTYRGISDVEQGRYELGIEALTRAIQMDPDHIEAYKTRGYARNALGDHQGALADYERAVALKPHDAGALQGRGRSKEALGDLDGAIADFDAALDYEPKRVEAYLGRASSRAKLGDADGAQSDYTKALQIDPENGKGYLMRASLHFDEERWDEAVFGLGRGIEEVEEGPARDGAELLLWAARSRKGETAAANEGLRTYARTREAAAPESTGHRSPSGGKTPATDDGRWLRTLAGFLTGDGSEHEETSLVEAAGAGGPKTPSERTCEALFYAGQKRLVTGDEKGALDRFRRGAGMCGEGFYAGARSAASVRSVLMGMRTMALARAPESRRPAGSGGSGLLVTRVHEGGPASRAGLAAGDAILTIDGTPATQEVVGRIESNGRPGDVVRLEIVEGAEEDAVSPGGDDDGDGKDVSGAKARSESPGEGEGSPAAGSESAKKDATSATSTRMPAPRKTITLTLG